MFFQLITIIRGDQTQMEGYRMYLAKIMHNEGKKKIEIAKRLDVDRRTVYNYLNDKVFNADKPLPGRPSGSLKLSPFFDYIEERLDDDLYLNGQVLFTKLVSFGYTGKTTILNDYLRIRREDLVKDAVYRFETFAGQQAQVDWAECGHVWQNGKLRKRYCFVLKLGYSRRSYMEFTTSMKQPILFACMKRAFDYFGGICSEILFDNMKTAFLYDNEKCQWIAHPKMAAFAAHYGFKPRRCRVRRPQTKGKVEREIRYLKSSFFPNLRYDGFDIQSMSTEKLNEHVLAWLKRVDIKMLRQFSQSRIDRFKADYEQLQPLPVSVYDHRINEPLKVSREGKVTFQTNTYSVHASYLNKWLEGKYDPDKETMTMYFEGKEIKQVTLFPQGFKKELVDPKDYASLIKAWDEGRLRRERHIHRQIEKKKQQAEQDNCIQHPSIFDSVFCIKMDEGVMV